MTEDFDISVQTPIRRESILHLGKLEVSCSAARMSSC
jgi:hypothetical protein